MPELHVCTCGSDRVIDAAGVDCPREGCGALIGASCHGAVGESLDRAHEERARLAVAESHGCAVVAYRDVCRFEQALAEPVQAQVDAAVAAIEAGMERHGSVVFGAEEIAREVLAAAAAVVLERPPCTSCGRPLGTGTLLDYSPNAPMLTSSDDAVGKAWAEVVPPRGPAGIARGLWEEFAARYRCPVCAETVPDGS